MKRTVILICMLVFSLLSFTQITPPKQVSDAFAKKFTNAEKTEWEQENENEWEAEFIVNNNEMSACFDNSGKWLETETEILKKDLPAEVFKSICLEFNGFDIDDVDSIEKSDFKGFEITLEKNETEVEILVTAEGNISILKIKVDDDDDDDENHEKCKK